MSEELQIFFPPDMAPHVQKVLQGEYDIAYNHASPVILDIGANIGAFALWALMLKWPRAMVHCYEPNPDAIAYLKQNLALFGTNTEIHPVAVGHSSKGKRKLFQGLNNLGEASFFNNGEQDLARSIEVDVLHPADLPRADVMKIDVEGAELEILELIQQSPDVILMEYHGEERRRDCDELLGDYVLAAGFVTGPGRGTFKYLHKRLLK